jgi:hypothetical protein
MVKVGDWVTGDFNIQGDPVFPKGYIVQEISGHNIRPVAGRPSAPNKTYINVLIERPRC